MINWEDLVGYKVDSAETVEAVLDDIVKLSNGDRYRAEYPVDSEVFEGDEAAFFVQEFTLEGLARQREICVGSSLPYDRKQAWLESIESLDQSVRTSPARCLRFYRILVNDEVFDVEEI